MNKIAHFHDGELLAQQRANESERAARNGANVSERIIVPALPFVRQQKILYVASIDEQGRVWASVLIGEPGFLQPSEDASVLVIDLTQVARQTHDPLWENLKHDKRLGLLLLDLQTRKRLKINGNATLDNQRLTLQVTESVPICPRYIQRRTIELSSPNETAVPANVLRGNELGAEQIQLIQHADTFFLASVHATRGADCSHRGGPRGFAHVLGHDTLRIPDYNGNSMFNSFGNFLVDPQAGLVFPDYEQRRLLQLHGSVELFWDQPDPLKLTGGTGRFWEFKTCAWIETRLPEALRSEYGDASSFLPKVAP